MARHRGGQKPVEYKKNITRTIRLTIEADEQTLDRLATLLLFAQPPFEFDESVGLCADAPWPLGDAGKPDDAELARIPEDELRVEITKRVTFLVGVAGVEFVKNMLAEYNVTRASQLEGTQLRRFHDDLVKSTPKYKPADSESPA